MEIIGMNQDPLPHLLDAMVETHLKNFCRKE
jgi:hypothetical protein